jgi:hypothetical protein
MVFFDWDRSNLSQQALTTIQQAADAYKTNCSDARGSGRNGIQRSDIVRVLTNGGPLTATQIFATWAFKVGIESGDIPQGAAVSLFMAPILAVAAAFILRNISRRGSEV